MSAMGFRSKESDPESPLQFYIRLYCKRKDVLQTTQMGDKIVLEATKSWTTLSDEEKLQFVNKYNECRKKQRDKLANYLKQTQPYLKKKQKRNDIPVMSNSIEELQNNIQQTHFEPVAPNVRISDIDHQDDLSINNTLHETDNIAREMSSHSLNEMPVYCNKEVNSDNQPTHSEPILIEPMPPIVSHSKELFEMIQEQNKNRDLSWSQLTRTEKNRYRRAVSLLKKKYISDFKAYLESLPSKELFNYYVNNIS